MPHAFLTPTGHIRQVVPKPTPFMRLEPGERLVRYDPPAIDEELQTALPVEPVPDGAETVEFTVQDQPAEVVRKVLTRRMTDAVRAKMDQEAQAHDYDSILSAASYATSSHPKFGPEGKAFSAWRDACWEYGYALLDEVLAGTKPMPTDAQIWAGMPVLEL